LYYALAGTILSLPSLRDRTEDIESLTLLLIGELNIKLGKQIVGIRPQAVEELKRLKWNGNLNELKRFIQESMVLANGPFLEYKDVKRATVIKERAEISAHIDLNGTLEEIERKIIRKVWREEGMNQTKTAQRLGINRTTLWRKLK
jgi:DNA-binding NtrC family response regulator